MPEKYFIAIVPPEPILREIQDLKQSIFEIYGTKGALRSPAHITLHMPFSYDADREYYLIEKLQEFRFVPKFDIKLSNFSCFEPRVIYIAVESNPILFDLQKQLVMHVKRQLQLFNQSDDLRGFHPHVTVAFRDLKKQTFYEVWDSYKDKIYSAEFTCCSFYLLKHQEQKWLIHKEFEFVTP